MCKNEPKIADLYIFTHSASYFRAKFKVKEAEIGVAGKGFGLRADWDSRRLIV